MPAPTQPNLPPGADCPLSVDALATPLIMDCCDGPLIALLALDCHAGPLPTDPIPSITGKNSRFLGLFSGQPDT